MVSTLVAVAVLQAQPAVLSTRFDLGERLKTLDIAWLANTDRARRAAAVTPIRNAVTQFFAAQWGEASRSLDQARAVLEGDTVLPEDAVSLRFVPAVVEPGKSANLRISWAYAPREGRAVRVAVGGREVTVAPGRTATLEVNPLRADPDLALSPESGTSVGVAVGSRTRLVALSIVKSPRARVAALVQSQDPIARAMGEQLQTALDRPEAPEQDIPFLQWLFMAEQLSEGRQKISDLEDFPHIRHGNTVMRAHIPRAFRGDPRQAPEATVVLAFHGAGGSENLFFEGYGRGLAVAEARRRGWVFIAPRLTDGAARDALDWVTTVRRLRVRQVFVMGHSLGGAYAVNTFAMRTRPAAAALMAPAVMRISREPAVPVYLAVGKHEIPRLLASSRAIGRELADRDDFEYEEFDASEHLMIVADAIPNAFRFFDRYAK